MSTPVPAGATCAQHPEREAASLCNRCGGFMCTGCECRVRTDSPPMCPGCFSLRNRTVKPQKLGVSTPLDTVGLILGCICVLPLFPIIIGSLVVNIIVLLRWFRQPADARPKILWKPLLALGITLLWPVGFLILMLSKAGR